MATESHDSGTTALESNHTRRRFMQFAGAAAVGAAFGAQPAAAQSLDESSEYVPNPRLEGTVTVAEHTPDMSSPLEYVNDSGELTSLADYGGDVAPRPTEGEPHNPVTINPAKIRADDMTAFPRGETYDSDSDGEDDSDVRAVDATHWTVDESSTAGTMTVADETNDADADVLRVETSSQGAGDVAVAEFTDFELGSGELRRYLQLVVDVDTLESGALVEVEVEDGSGNTATAKVDPSGDSANADVVATATGQGYAYQAQLGDLADTLDTLGTLRVRVSEANASVLFSAINVEKESRWSFGTEEYVDADDELDTRDLYEPQGDVSITSLDSVSDELAGGHIHDVAVDVELAASRYPDSTPGHELTDAGRYDYDTRFRLPRNLLAPDAYDLSWSGLEATDVSKHPGNRYVRVASSNSLTERVELADYDDTTDWGTDRTSSYEDAGLDGSVTVTTAVTPGEYVGLVYDVLLTSDEADDVEGGAVAGGPVGSGGGGMLSSVQGIALGLAVGIGTLVAKARGWLPFMG